MIFGPQFLHEFLQHFLSKKIKINTHLGSLFIFPLYVFCFFEFLIFGILLISGRLKVKRWTTGRDMDQQTKVFEFVKLILRP